MDSNTDLTPVKSDSLDKASELSPKMSRQASRITGLAADSTIIIDEEVNTTRSINDLQMMKGEKDQLTNTKIFRRAQSEINIGRAQKWSPQMSRQASQISGLAACSTTNTEEEVIPTRRRNDLQMTEKEKEELMVTKTFLRIQADIKEQQRRLRPRKNVVQVKTKSGKQQYDDQNYVDMSRQIANIQGTMCVFIKLTLFLHKTTHLKFDMHSGD